MLAYLFLMKNVYFDKVYAAKNIQCKILFIGSEPFYKVSLTSDEYKYLNIRVK